jgi:hypothetical protein
MRNNGVYREGFWKNKDNPNLPFPIANNEKWIGQDEFVEKLKEIEKSLSKTDYRGWSTCRLCKIKTMNGIGEYRCNIWLWPEGFLHYVEKHNVRPSLAFQEFVIGKELGE